MRNKRLMAAGILGGVLALSFGSGISVRADASITEIANDDSAALVMEEDSWVNKAAADVDSYANVRTEASVESEKAGVMPKGASALVIGQEGEWTRISSGDVEGYVKTEFLAFAEEAKELYETTYGNQGTVTASSLRVRNAPSLDGEQIGSQSCGSRVQIISRMGDWYQVEYGGAAEAYVAAEYIQIEEATAITLNEFLTGSTALGLNAAVISGGDLDLLAAIIQCEAGGESHTGKVAVGAVIMNRVRSSQFPNSIAEVVYQSGQFTPASSGALSRVLSQGARADCYQAAREALAGSNPIGTALYFNSGSGRGQQIGNQHFY